jgi:N-acetylmuramoyl-L-alanine amidase
MQIPLKPGLKDAQKNSITTLVEGKSVTNWSMQDKANWVYATNNAPLPVEVEEKPTRTLFVDLGHSTKFPGAFGVKSEVLWNRSIWEHLRNLLDTSKWNVVLVPESYGWSDLTSNLNLIHRIQFINKNCKDGDWVLSIHGNAASNPNVRGVTTCYMGGSEYMRRKAIELSQVFSDVAGIPLWGSGAFDDRTSRYKRLGMVRDTRPPALLIEAGFVTNKSDMAVEPRLAAEAIAQWFNNK